MKVRSWLSWFVGTIETIPFTRETLRLPFSNFGIRWCEHCNDEHPRIAFAYLSSQPLSKSWAIWRCSNFALVYKFLVGKNQSSLFWHFTETLSHSFHSLIEPSFVLRVSCYEKSDHVLQQSQLFFWHLQVHSAVDILKVMIFVCNHAATHGANCIVRGKNEPKTKAFPNLALAPRLTRGQKGTKKKRCFYPTTSRKKWWHFLCTRNLLCNVMIHKVSTDWPVQLFNSNTYRHTYITYWYNCTYIRHRDVPCKK